uniref:Transposase n=1 Tax=viral metagenome TaxID=1070528 RepID=A0A6C0CSH1_9ZZZZ
MPSLDEKFILYCIKATGTRDNRGRKAENEVLQTELEDFYQKEFQPLLAHAEKHDLRNFTYLLPYLATQMHTGLHNNLKEHFITRLLRFINKTTATYEEGLTTEEVKKERRALKDALFANEPVPQRYMEWAEQHRNAMLPSSWDVSLPYDVKVFPVKYLTHSFYMNSVLEAQGFKLFQPMSMRSNIVPHYITFDTASLINLFADKGSKGAMLKQVKANQEEVWNRLFNLDKRIFRQKNYHFNFTLQTDGVGVSLLFVHRDYNGRKSCPCCATDDSYPFHYVEDLYDEQLESLKGRNIVGADPGKFNLLYLADGKGKKLRYTAFQRRTESLSKRNHRILLNEKARHGVTEKETELSEQNSKTVDYDKFKTYLIAKNKLNQELRSFYEQELYRKMKWRQFVYTQKSEDRFLNKMEEAYGEDAVIAYGDWSRTTQMKHFMPTKGVGLRKLVAKRFQTVSVNEFRTSKLCCRCHDELCHLRVKEDNINKKVFRCLVCNGCASSESKQPVFVTRDLNSAQNIRQLALDWLNERKRPSVFHRTEGLTFTLSREKVGQSVDFTVGKATVS